jgi:hypothetical protein
MSTETTSNVGSAEHNRLVARRWIDAFNARDDAAEAAARTHRLHRARTRQQPPPIPMDARGSDLWLRSPTLADPSGRTGIFGLAGTR